MTVKQFSEKHRLKFKIDEAGDYITGKQGDIYEVASGTLAVSFMPPSKTDPVVVGV